MLSRMLSLKAVAVSLSGNQADRQGAMGDKLCNPTRALFIPIFGNW